MSGKAAVEIAQHKPFACLEEEAFINIARSYEHMQQGFTELFRNYNLSTTQYNVLRILRGAGPDGLSCSEAAQRMISHDPDITRLFDRLEARGLVRRERSSADRRIVLAFITPAGLELLESADGPVNALHREQMSKLSPDQVEQLVGLLELLRP